MKPEPASSIDIETAEVELTLIMRHIARGNIFTISGAGNDTPITFSTFSNPKITTAMEAMDKIMIPNDVFSTYKAELK